MFLYHWIVTLKNVICEQTCEQGINIEKTLENIRNLAFSQDVSQNCSCDFAWFWLIKTQIGILNVYRPCELKRTMVKTHTCTFNITQFQLNQRP